jgi:hypothetical protein
MKFVLILYYCLSTGCYTVEYPELYWSSKDCSIVSTDIIEHYRSLEKISPKVPIDGLCIENELTWLRLPI